MRDGTDYAKQLVRTSSKMTLMTEAVEVEMLMSGNCGDDDDGCGDDGNDSGGKVQLACSWSH